MFYVISCSKVSKDPNPTQRMSKRSKNLIFIFNKTDVDYDNSSSLVRLYMNRGIIYEDDQFEILGVGNLISKTNGNIESRFQKIIEKHASISSRILNNSFRLKNADIHLIVGNVIINDSKWDYSNWDFYQDYYRYFEDHYPIKPHLISNKFKKLSSYTLLNENKNRLRQSKDLDVLHVRSKKVKPLTINPDADLFFENLSQRKFKRLKFKFKNLGCFPRIRRRRHGINESSIALQRFKLLSVSELERVEKEVHSLTQDKFALAFAIQFHSPNSEHQKFQNLTNSLNSEQTGQLEQSEQRTGRPADFERTARTPNSPNTKNFENSRTGRTVRTPTVRTLVDPATDIKEMTLPPFLNSLRVKNIPATLRYYDTTEGKDIEYSHVEYVGLRFTYVKADAKNDLEIELSNI